MVDVADIKQRALAPGGIGRWVQRSLVGFLVLVLLLGMIAALSFLLVPRPFIPRNSPAPPPLNLVIVAPERSVDALVSDFYTAIGEVDEKPWPYMHTGFRADAFEIAYAVLRKQTPDSTLLALLTHPGADIRNTAVLALGDAQNVLGADGHAALQSLWRRTNAAVMVPVITEAVIVATKSGADEGHLAYLLASMGDAARDAVPALIWTADNHPVANMRIWAMNNAHHIAPDDPVVAAASKRRLSDGAPAVRREALQTTTHGTLADLVARD